MKTLIFTLFLMSLSIFPQQVPDTLWTRTYGSTGLDYCLSIKPTPDGNFILLGNSKEEGASFYTTWLMKLTLNGDTLWLKKFGGIIAQNIGIVEVTNDGGYVMGGSIKSLDDTNYDLYLFKTDADGNFLWSKRYSTSEVEYVSDIKETSDGGLIISGVQDHTWQDLWLLKTNSVGDTLWTKIFGGSSSDFGMSVQETDDGYAVTGWTGSFGVEGDFWLISTDFDGNENWMHTYGGIGYQEGHGLIVTSDGGFLLSGASDPTNGFNYKWYLVKTNKLGDTLWTKIFGNGTAQNIRQTSDGGYIVCGPTAPFAAFDNFQISRLSSNGIILWNNTILGSLKSCHDIQILPDGGYIAVGGVLTSATGFDFYIVRFASDPATTPVELTSFTGSTIAGNVILNWSTASELNNMQFEIQRKTETSEFYTIGTVKGAGTTTINNNYSFSDKSAGSGTFFYRLKQLDFNGSFNYSDEVKVEVFAAAGFTLSQNYPNPFNPSTIINFNLPTDSKVTMKVYNIMGEKITTLVNGFLTAGNHSIKFNSSGISNGMYIYKLEAAGNNGTVWSSAKKMTVLK